MDSESILRNIRRLKRGFLNACSELNEKFKLTLSKSNFPEIVAAFNVAKEARNEICAFIDDVYKVHFKMIDDDLEVDLTAVEECIRSDFTKVCCSYERIKAEYEEIMHPPAPISPRTSTLSTTLSDYAINSIRTTRLPMLNLPTFNGDVTKFLDFKAAFQTAVHDVEELTNVQKLQYLKSTLVGNAANVLIDMPMVDSAYEPAWNAVIRRFENKRAIIRALFTKLFAMKKVTSETGVRNLLDQFDGILRALENAGIKKDNLSEIASFFLASKLDDVTTRDWENSITDNSVFPAYDTLQKFLVNRAFAIEERAINVPKVKPIGSTKAVLAAATPAPERTTLKHQKVNYVKKCVVCGADHLLIDCRAFRDKTPTERYDTIKKARLCISCFRSDHALASCSKVCSICNGRHHRLLHRGERPNQLDNVAPASQGEQPSTSNASNSDVINSVCNVTSFSASVNQVVVLPTAVVKVQIREKYISARVLLDTASQITLVSEHFVKSCNFDHIMENSNTQVTGVGGSSFNCSQTCQLFLRSRVSDFGMHIVASVAPKFSYAVSPNLVRAVQVKKSPLGEVKIRYDNVDILLGAQYVGKVLIGAVECIHDLAMQNTQFGWVLYGSVASEQPIATHCHFVSNVTTAEVDKKLAKFWETEELSVIKDYEDDDAIVHFTKNTKRLEDGRFSCRLPFKRNPSEIKESRNRALQMLFKLERTLPNDTRALYVDFMREYIQLGHMELVDHRKEVANTYYIPHRAVLRPSSTTTKLRVVFNASAKSIGGLSLNDILLVGPKVQQDILDILVRFREYKYAFSADVEKMYRQIEIAEDDRPLQRILWRENIKEPVREYELKTVTYGTASASFLATKCLQELSKEIAESDPIASRAIRCDFYMDDLMTGSDTLEDALHLQRSIHTTLENAKFPLRKYVSNSGNLLAHVPFAYVEKNRSISFLSEEAVSVLGLSWCPDQDKFAVKVSCSELPQRLTKREVLSYASSLYDPLGFVAPITITAKIIMQDVWKARIGWDETVPQEISAKFRKYYEELKRLQEFSIPRRYSSLLNVVSRKVIGFCDASEKAYCAVVYLLCADASNKKSCNLICAKTKVAPIKTTLTIPRIELEGALLLKKLLERVTTNLNVPIHNVFAYSDSMIVIGWLNMSPERLQPYVLNRVRKITSYIQATSWSHVRGEVNPADLGTRGIPVSQFLKNELWLKGPSWLVTDAAINEKVICVTDFNLENLPELRFCCSTANRVYEPVINFRRFSNFNRLINSVAYVIRFLKNSRVLKEVRKCSSLTVSERSESRSCVLKLAQSENFPEETRALKTNSVIKSRSPLSGLNVFLDNEGVMRVRTRLTNSPYAENFKYPIVLHAKSLVLELYVRYLHDIYFHIGIAQILTLIRSTFYVIGSITNVVKKVISRCVVCRIYRAKPDIPMMADLPADRTTPDRPFSTVGVDFAGPFETKCTAHRTTKYFKSYAAIFVCFVCRAVHIEVVEDLSTAKFLSALQRFMSRRGVPRRIYSDNATNFQGAARALNLKESTIQDEASSRNIDWRFITPRAPHHGGLWEAAVKVAKTHLMKVTKGAVLSFPEYVTIFSSVEAIMNSRPISYKSQSKFSFSVLTPSHFLIGSSLLINFEDGSAAEEKSPIDLMNHCETLRKIVNSFWHGFKTDYLCFLRNRKKWMRPSRIVRVGDLVVLREDNVKPGQWPKAVVEEVYPDQRGIVRTVLLRTQLGFKKRSVDRLVQLVDSSPSTDSSTGGVMLRANM